MSKAHTRPPTADSTPSAVETAAQDWHATRHTGTTHPEGWFDCRRCRADNPHRAVARRVAFADIRARILDSIASTRQPPPPEQGVSFYRQSS